MSIHNDPRRFSTDEDERREWENDLRMEYAPEEYERTHPYECEEEQTATKEDDYDCMSCAHDGDSNICWECEDGSKYRKWRSPTKEGDGE